MKRLLSLFFFIQVVIASFGQKNNLDYYVNQALTNSPLLVDFQNQLLSFRLDSQLIHAALRPQVNGIGNGLQILLLKEEQELLWWISKRI